VAGNRRRFEPVRFAHVLAGQGGTGAAVAARWDGAWVVDLWGGRGDAAGARRWQPGSLVRPYSVTKPFAAVCALPFSSRVQVRDGRRGVLAHVAERHFLEPDVGALPVRVDDRGVPAEERRAGRGLSMLELQHSFWTNGSWLPGKPGHTMGSGGRPLSIRRPRRSGRRSGCSASVQARRELSVVARVPEPCSRSSHVLRASHGRTCAFPAELAGAGLRQILNCCRRAHHNERVGPCRVRDHARAGRPLGRLSRRPGAQCEVRGRPPGPKPAPGCPLRAAGQSLGGCA
jgi:hypothetical protein